MIGKPKKLWKLKYPTSKHKWNKETLVVSLVTKVMSKDKAKDADGLSIDLIKDASDFLLDKLAVRT